MSVRARKVSDVLKRQIGDIIQKEIKDPRVGFVTVSHVKISEDLKLAKVYFSVLPEKGDEEKSLTGLNSAKQFIRNELNKRVRLRYIPELQFFVDHSLDYVEKIEDIIAKTKKQ